MIGSDAAAEPDSGVAPLAFLLGALFGLGGLGSTALAVVLPEASSALDVSIGDGTWMISLYVITMAISTPVYGRLVDVVGVRAPLLVGVGLMSAGAALAAIATSFPVMVVARLLQGLGTGVGPTLSVAVIGTRYASHERTRGLGIAAAMAAAIGAAGPLIGGVTESLTSWRGTAALPALGLVLLLPLWRRTAGPVAGGAVDGVGALVVSVAAGGAIVLLQSPSAGATTAVVGAAMAATGVPLALIRSRRAASFLPAAVLLNRRILLVCLAAGTVPAAWFALLVAVPTKLAASGASPLVVGLELLPTVLVAVLTPRCTRGLTSRVGPAVSLTVAAVLSTVALVVGGAGVRYEAPVAMISAVGIVSAAFSLGQPSLFAIVSEVAASAVRGVAMGFATLAFLTCGSAGAAVVGGLSGHAGVHGSLFILAAVCAGGVALASCQPSGWRGDARASGEMSSVDRV